MANTVKLTFAGDSKNLESTFARVGHASKVMSDKVKESSKGFDDAGRNVSKFGEGVEAAGRLAIPAAATAAALLGAAVAPALAVALAGGVLLALSGGVLIAGIAAAAGDPKVTKAFKGLQTNATKAFANFGKPFVQPLSDAITYISGKLAGWANLFKPVTEKLAPVITEFAHGLGGLVDNALPAIANAAGNAAPAFKAMAGFLPTIGTWIGVFVTKMADLFTWGMKNKTMIGNFISVAAPIVGVFLGIIAAIRVWIAVQTILNVVMALNPIGLIIIAIAALVAIVVIVATKTTWFQRLWGTAWGAIKTAASNVWNWIKQIPGWIGDAFSKVGDAISAPFKTAFNYIANAWNSGPGALSFTVPDWVPVIGGDGFSMPKLPTFHSGGVVPGVVGSNVLAMVQAGERVGSVASGGDDMVIQLNIGNTALGDVLIDAVRGAVRTRGGNVQAVLGRG